MSRLRLALGAGALVVAVFAACASGDGEQSDGSGGLSTPGDGAGGNGTGGSSPGGSSGAAGNAAGDGGAGKGNPDASMFPDGSAGAAGSGTAGGGGAGSAGSSGSSGSGGAGAGGATGGSAGASAGSAGAGGGCVPACAGKQCGPDGCSGQCGPGCGADQTCDASGTCVTSCKPTWSATLSGVTPGRAALDPTGALYVVGAEGDKPWVGAFDRCAGTTTATAKVPIGASGRFIGVSLSPTSVYAVGTADGDGSFAKLTKGSLAVELSGPLVGSNEQDETWDIAQSPKGNVWATGTANVPTPAFWMIQATATQGPCGFGPIDGKGVGRAIAISGGSVFVAGARNDQGIVARFDDASCFATSPCSCVPAQTSTPIQLGAAMTELRSIVVAGGKAYVAGFASDTTAGDVFAVLARVDLASLTVESSFTWNPTPQIDAFVALAADATQVYAAGGRGWAGEASFATSTGVLVALPLAFGPSTQQAWNAQPSGARVMWGVATGDGAVYAAGATAGGGLVTKCATATGCPLAARGERGERGGREGARGAPREQTAARGAPCTTVRLDPMSPSRPATPFLETAKKSLLVFDGAMGSLLYERGIFVTQNFEQLNVTRPDVVRKIHGDYVEAGAQVILSNTFGANRFRLERHGLVGEVRAFNLAGARLAREVAGETVYVAGSMGPTGLVPGVSTRAEYDATLSTFTEQAAALAEGGADLLVLETFRHLEELAIAVAAAKKGAPGLPIIASVTFDSNGTVADGSEPEAVAERVRDLGIDVLGVNCGDGPQLSLSMAERMRGPGLPLCVAPNAGLPRNVDGRLLYMATPEYFDVFARRMLQAGATMIGGCCGTTPEHVKWMAKSVRMFSRTTKQEPSARAEAVPEIRTGQEPVPLAERSAFAAKLAAGKFVVSVEVNPAPGLSAKSALDASKMLIDAGVDIVNVADGPRATARMSNLAFCALLLREHGIESMLHVCGRDRNLLAQMAHLLGAYVSGIHNLVVITGDPPKVGDYPEATAVYDLDSIGLLKMASEMNRGVDPAGKPLAGGKTHFLCATGFEPGAADLDREIARLEQKAAAGADLVMTQPVFQQDLLERVLARIEHLKLPVMIGVLPLVSYKNAEFLHNEVPGMQIPEEIRERMRGVPAGPEARKEGVKIAREMLFAVRDRVQGAYLMPPLGKYELALQVLDGLKRD